MAIVLVPLTAEPQGLTQDGEDFQVYGISKLFCTLLSTKNLLMEQ